MSGSEFDQTFAKQMLKDHDKDIRTFEKATGTLKEADLKQFAENCLPKLRQHLQQAADVAKAVGVDQSTISSYLKRAPGSVGGTTDDSRTSQGAGGKNQTDDQTAPKKN